VAEQILRASQRAGSGHEAPIKVTSGPTERVVAILNFLADHTDEAFSLSEIARRLQLNKATVRSVLASLVDSGYVIRQQSSFMLGPALIVLGKSAANPNRAVSLARMEMYPVAKETGLDCVITVLVGDDLVFLDTTGDTSVRWPRVPFVSPFGGHFIAWEADDAITKWMRSGSIRGRASEQIHRKILERIRELRYSVVLPVDLATMRRQLIETHDFADIKSVRRRIRNITDQISGMEHYILGAFASDGVFLPSAIHAPVFDADTHVRLALSLTGFEEPISGERIRLLGEYLVVIADRITQAVGGSIPESA
jgi:DNA-binding IclR family transcriptional regulator